MSMQGDPAASLGVTPGTPGGDETLDDAMQDGAVDGSDTELPAEGDEAAGIAADGSGAAADEDAR
jgi:hypothetical protein